MNYAERSGAHDMIAEALRVAAGLIHRILVKENAANRLNLEDEDILNDFYLYLAERDARPLRIYDGRKNAQYGSYVARVFQYWLWKRLAKKQAVNVKPIDNLGINETTNDSPVYDALRVCIANLETSEQKQMVDFFMDVTTKLSEIAKRMNMPQSSIYPIWEKTKRQLRSCLESKGFGQFWAV